MTHVQPIFRSWSWTFDPPGIDSCSCHSGRPSWEFALRIMRQELGSMKTPFGAFWGQCWALAFGWWWWCLDGDELFGCCGMMNNIPPVSSNVENQWKSTIRISRAPGDFPATKMMTGYVVTAFLLPGARLSDFWVPLNPLVNRSSFSPWIPWIPSARTWLPCGI